jgi:hypothetical protein
LESPPHPTTPHPQWLFLGFAIRVLKETSSSNPVMSPPTWETPNTIILKKPFKRN